MKVPIFPVKVHGSVEDMATVPLDMDRFLIEGKRKVEDKEALNPTNTPSTSAKPIISTEICGEEKAERVICF